MSLRAVGLMIGVAAAIHASPSLAATPSWTAGLRAALPADAGGNPDAHLDSVSCPSAGNCSAVGAYQDSSAHSQGLLLTESSHVWSVGQRAPLPPDLATNPFVGISSVSCVSAGRCVAAGRYDDSLGHSQGLLLRRSAGVWTAIKAPLPPDAATDPSAFLNSVSCVSAGSCTAVGSYNDASGKEGLLLTEASGSWTAEKMTPPADAGANPLVALDDVSCATAGDCVAIGAYRDNLTKNQALLVSRSSGTWSTAFQPPLPADAMNNGGNALRSVACPTAGNCAVVGAYYDTAGNTQGLLLRESSGAWTAFKAALPADAGNTSASVDEVSCASTGRCTAVGDYDDASAHQQGLLLTKPSATWSPGKRAPVPANAGTNPNVSVDAVSCFSAGNCRAVGSYDDSSTREQGLLLSQSSGAWSAGVKLIAPPGAGTNPEVDFESVSCASAGACSAVGSYVDSSGRGQALLVRTAAAISNLHVSPSEFSLAGRKVSGRCVKPTQKNNQKQHCRRPIKLAVSYTLDIPDRVTFTIKRKAGGRKVNGRCVKQTPKNRKRPKCTRLVKLRGRIVRNGKAGGNTFTFKGKIGGRKIGRGTYQLLATTAGGTRRKVTFKIVR